ncbi:type I restriction endonuclease subunit R [Paenibacillus sp. Soil750]|uniref:type I restriction endonuclease subunit R n=1 Tax=Paenibacillus sp. Soil750 TaxID=1736398 RepID=UPI00070193C8|nr:type I restriction endonuclease subunit R [Paenibacillus sp. Soil750]KRE73913.1 deoxyribonuclease [Paenibacillus sp. Soil750]
MPRIITEDMIEQATIKLLVESNGYNAMNCFTPEKETLPDGTGRENKKQVVLQSILFKMLCKINPTIPVATIKSVVETLRHTPHTADLMAINCTNYQMLRTGITVKYEVNGKQESNTLNIIDYKEPLNNNFTVVSQMWIKGEAHWRRPDLIIFINGLPLVFIELKNSNILVKNAYDKNLTDYLKDIPYLFDYNQICVLSNGVETRVGSFKAGYEHFFEWLKVDSEKEKPNREQIKENGISIELLINGLLKKESLIDYIENFILFDRRRTKIIAKNHQFLGINKAFYSFVNRESLKGKLGVFWHTQGSGKSYSMVMFARKIKHKCAGNFTFLVVTDRQDLDDQLYKNFLRTEFIAKDEDVRPANSAKLREQLATNKSIIFTMIHKFRYDKGKKYPILSERKDIIVMVDEAHRTQYKDLAENMRNGLPNAQYIAFTGTPLLGSKRLTSAWFGDYVSEYNFSQSIEDGATVPLYYTKRVPTVELSNEFLDSDFSEILEKDNLTDEEQKRLENHYAKELEVIKRDDRLETIAQDIAYHFPRRGFLGKGMVICVDKFTAVRMYDKVAHYWKEEIKRLNKEIKTEKDGEKRLELKRIVDYMREVQMAVVISYEDGEEEKFADQGLSIKKHRDYMNAVDDNGFDLEDHFKNEKHPFQLVFVCSMWLTGFDAPSVSTMYLDKPMQGHTLMQTIARANRVFPGKDNGIIVDYLDVFKYMKRALADYATSEEENMPVKDIEKLVDLLNQAIDNTTLFCGSIGIDLNELITKNDTFKKLDLFEGFANTILQNDEWKNEFKVYSNTVEMLYESLRPDIFKMDWTNPLKEAILYLRGIIAGKIRPDKLEEARKKIDTLLDQSVVAEQAAVYELAKHSKEIDLSKLNIDELREQFKKIKYKNIEIANLRDYITKKLEQMLKKNLTRSNFAELFQNIIDNYNAGGSTNDDFFEKLLEFMEKLKAEDERHIKEELTEEELEIFDLLRKEKLSAAEEKKVKLAAKMLYETLTQKKSELFVVGWHNDPQPKERVKSEIITVLNSFLPDSYGRDVFTLKSNIVYEHIIDQAITGFGWIAS